MYVHNIYAHCNRKSEHRTGLLISLLLLLILSCMYICVVVIGAVFIQDSLNATVSDNTFENNQAGGTGGAVFSDGPVTADGSNVFNGNTPNDVVDT